MPEIPNQKRFVDPYSYIISTNSINYQLSLPMGPKYIVSGLDVTPGGNTLLVSSGKSVIDGTLLETGGLTVDISSLTIGVDYVLYFQYDYQLQQSKPQATFETTLLSQYNDDIIKLRLCRFKRVSANSVDVFYDVREESLNDKILDLLTTGNLNMQGYQITDLPTPTQPGDIATKQYVDQLPDEMVAVISGDSIRTFFLEVVSNAINTLTTKIC